MAKERKIFHVYVLASASERIIKVGKSNNTSRVPALARMCYGGAHDWCQVKMFPVDSNHAAVAIESMIHARLANEGYRRGRFSWINKLNLRESFADECFTCSAEHAIAVGQEMFSIYRTHIVGPDQIELTETRDESGDQGALP